MVNATENATYSVHIQKPWTYSAQRATSKPAKVACTPELSIASQSKPPITM